VFSTEHVRSIVRCRNAAKTATRSLSFGGGRFLLLENGSVAFYTRCTPARRGIPRAEPPDTANS